MNWLANRWWEVIVVLLAVNSILFGVLFTSSGNADWGLATGFAPAILLLSGLGLNASRRLLSGILIVVGSVAASAPFWTIYPVVLAIGVIGGGFGMGRIGPQRSKPELVA